jgi:hypothetical protein
MKGFIGVTDNDWFAFLSQHPDIHNYTINPFNKKWYKEE